MDVRRARFGRVQRETTQERKTIKHRPTLRERAHTLIIQLLIEVITRLVSRSQIDLELEAVKIDFDRIHRLTEKHSVHLRQTLKFARTNIVTLQNRTWRENALKHLGDLSLSLIHAKRRSL